MANLKPAEGLNVLINSQNKWFWLFVVNGIMIVWSMRYFVTQEACLVDASNRHLIL